MIFYTIQNKNFIDNMYKNFKSNKYHVSENNMVWLKKNKPDLAIPYFTLKNLYGYKTYPIFGCIEGCISTFHGAQSGRDDLFIIKLDIPKEELNIQNYYNWTDYIYYHDNIDEIPDNMSLQYIIDSINIDHLNIDIYNYKSEIQSTIEHIKPNYLKGIIPITSDFDLHSNEKLISFF